MVYKDAHYTVDLPTDWLRIKKDKIMLVTRDGIDVQRITFELREHDKAFAETKQVSATSMLPSELADRYVAELRTSDEHGLPSLEIISDRPFTLDGRLGFQLHLRFLNDDGLRYERLVSGYANETGFFVVTYQAPSLHFFERDREVYQRVLRTFMPI